MTPPYSLSYIPYCALSYPVVRRYSLNLPTPFKEKFHKVDLALRKLRCSYLRPFARRRSVSPFTHFVFHILSVRAAPKMFGIRAFSIIAGMAYAKSRWIAIMQPVREPMHFPHKAFSPVSITVFIYTALPLPAAVLSYLYPCQQFGLKRSFILHRPTFSWVDVLWPRPSCGLF